MVVNWKGGLFKFKNFCILEDIKNICFSILVTLIVDRESMSYMNLVWDFT